MPVVRNADAPPPPPSPPFVSLAALYLRRAPPNSNFSAPRCRLPHPKRPISESSPAFQPNNLSPGRTVPGVRTGYRTGTPRMQPRKAT
eukprot:3789297-Rhodomonas_salina.2